MGDGQQQDAEHGRRPFLMADITFTMPRTWLLNANDRQHWRAKATKVRRLRDTATFQARAAHLPHMDRAHITITITWRTDRRRDPANWADTHKALIDGLVDARVLPDDDSHHVLGPDPRAAVDPTLDGKTVRITIQLDPWEES